MAQTVVPGSSLGDNRPTYIYKMVLLGSTSVGKSSLAYRYVKNDFKESLPTVGCSFFTQTIQLETATIKLEIWDTAGQEKYHSVCHLYYRGAHAALLVYDLTNKETFNRAKQWLMELEKEFLPDEIVIALVGNKTDLADEREVAAEDGEEFARSRSLLFMETSAKSNHQVNDIFMAVAGRGTSFGSVLIFVLDVTRFGTKGRIPLVLEGARGAGRDAVEPGRAGGRPPPSIPCSVGLEQQLGTPDRAHPEQCCIASHDALQRGGTAGTANPIWPKGCPVQGAAWSQGLTTALRQRGGQGDKASLVAAC
ncbi:ras-related protein Rab-17 isoform X1 [Meleagris gallopavo]|uniref:Ras-related protein Rab-17 n=1 Tax=Meleagris gallopavo TaxID=9103 RepID=G1MVU3_MELGA|nr:ras-related protein Rab-17 isoform X1 [Meleagris gallopavo]XP_019472421.1 ras-related protein Rab-17 isoform X1 [Meleagris gallopavo]XP_031409950.1 ras-related protein Rab-17 isoform X1 [Meleagris gallopavo]